MQQAMINYWNKYQNLLIFILYELLIIILAYFLGLQIIGAIFATFFGIAILPSLFLKDRKTLLFFVILITLLFIYSSSFLIIGKTNSQNALLSINPITGICFILAEIAFLTIGYGLIKKEKITSLCILILVFIGILVFISILLSLYIYQEIFHLIGDSPPYREAGKLFYIQNEITWLFGFSIKQISPSFIGGYVSISIAPALSLLYIRTNKINSSLFWSIIYVSIIGLLAIIIYPLFRSLIAVLISSFIVLSIIYFPKNSKQWKIVIISLSIFISVYLLLVILYNIDFVFLTSVINKLGPIKRLFNLTVFESSTFNNFVIVFGNLFTHPFGANTYLSTRNVFLDIINQVGAIPFIFLLLFVFFSCIICFKYYKHSSDNKQIKTMILAILIFYFVNSLINYNQYPLIKSSGYALPLLLDPLFLIILLLIGYCLSHSEIKTSNIISSKNLEK